MYPCVDPDVIALGKSHVNNVKSVVPRTVNLADAKSDFGTIRRYTVDYPVYFFMLFLLGSLAAALENCQWCLSSILASGLVNYKSHADYKFS